MFLLERHMLPGCRLEQHYDPGDAVGVLHQRFGQFRHLPDGLQSPEILIDDFHKQLHIAEQLLRGHLSILLTINHQSIGCWIVFMDGRL